MSESILTSHEIEHFTIDSQHAGFTYDVYLGGMPSAIPTDGPLPLLVVLDAYLMGLTAIETARLMGAVGEIEPFVIAAVSPAGGFEIGNTRRLRDFSAACEAPEDEPMFQNLLPRMKELGIEPKDAVGGSDDFRRFLVDELIPAVESKTEIDRGRLGLLGHSAGGSVLLETLLKADTPFRDFIVGEAGTFLMFGTEFDLLEKALELDDVPAKRAFYADSSDTMDAVAHLFKTDELLERIEKELGVEMKVDRYQGETHTTMLPMFIKDGLLHMYGTGVKYSDSFGG